MVILFIKIGSLVLLLGTLALYPTGFFFRPSLSSGPYDADGVKNLIVMIDCSIGDTPSYGAGIIFAIENGRMYIVTANHVVRRGDEQAKQIKVKFRWLPGETVVANLLDNFDNNLDLAVLSITKLRQLGDITGKIPLEKLRQSAEVGRRSNVYALGYPNRKPWDLSIDPDKVSDIRPNAITFRSNFVAVGHSGGALLDEEYSVIGLIQEDNPPDATVTHPRKTGPEKC